MIITGIIEKIEDTQVVIEGFHKREIIVNYSYNEKYPKEPIKFMVSGKEDSAKLDSFKKGDAVEIGFVIKGRMWDSKIVGVKYFNTLLAWNVRLIEENSITNL